MKRTPKLTTLMIGMLTSAALFATVTYGKDKDAPAAQNVTTVWVDGKGQESFAEKVNKVHAAMEPQGWKFSNFEIYIENGDMRGAFVTYIR
jgi:hypothetical protein